MQWRVNGNPVRRIPPDPPGTVASGQSLSASGGPVLAVSRVPRPGFLPRFLRWRNLDHFNLVHVASLHR